MLVFGPGLDGFVMKHPLREDGSSPGPRSFEVLGRHRGAAHRIAPFPTSYNEFLSVGQDGAVVLYDVRER